MFKHPRVLHVTSMWPTEDYPHSGTYVSDLVSALRKRGGVHDVFHIRTFESKLNYLKAASEISEQVAEGDYDLIHAQYAHCGIVSRFATHEIPVISHFHGEFGYRYWKGREYDVRTLLDRIKCRRDSMLARYIAARVEAVAVVQERDLEFIDNALTAVIPIGADKTLFFPGSTDLMKEDLGLDRSKGYVLFPGDPDRPDKNIRLFHQVMSILETRKLRVEPLVLHGILHSEVPRYMNAADVMLLTSFSEASPTVVKEANLCDLPVVSVPVGDVESQLQGISPGGVFDPDPLILAGAVQEILESKTRSNGRSVAEGKWDLCRTVDLTMNLYRRIIGDRK